VRTKEKNKYGEVFTPPALVEQMLNELSGSVFKNPEYKWLDPTAGVGNFTALVYLRLMNGLDHWQPDKKKRSEHIIENMLYMVELNKQNTNICKELFGEKANILQGDFLTSNVFNMHFDVIVGNPPFQDDIGISGKRVGSKNKLYERILSKCLHLLNNDNGGYVMFITPDNLFSGGSKVYLEMIEKTYVKMIHFDKSIQSYFPKIQQYMCYFVLQREGIKGREGMKGREGTLIIGNDGKRFDIVLQDRPVNPVRNWTPYTESLINKYISNKKNNAIYNRGKPIKDYKKSGGNYAIIYKPHENIYTNHLSLANGYGQKKIVLFLISPDLKFKSDFDGKYGVGPNTFYIPFQTNKQGLLLENFLNSKTYKLLALSTKTNRQFLKLKFIEHLNLDKILGKMNNFKTKKRKNKGVMDRRKHKTQKTRKQYG